MQDSDIKPGIAGETRSDPIINPARNAPAVRGRCRVGSRLLCALVALSPAILSSQYTQAGAPPQPIADVLAKVKAAVVEVVVRTMAIGSGFLIDRSGYIATNKHVIENAVAVFAATPACLLAMLCPILMRDRPEDAAWLDHDQQTWLRGRLDAEANQTPSQKLSLLQALASPMILILILGYLLITFAFTRRTSFYR
jgi:hypothetical protein